MSGMNLIPTRQKTVTAIDGTVFDDDPTTETSSAIATGNFREFLLLIDLAVTNTPTDALIEVLFSDDDSTYYKYMNGPFGDLRYEDSAGDKTECLSGPLLAPYMKIKVTCTGTDASNKFTLTVKAVLSG